MHSPPLPKGDSQSAEPFGARSVPECVETDHTHWGGLCRLDTPPLCIDCHHELCAVSDSADVLVHCLSGAALSPSPAGYSVCVVVTVGGAGERGGEDGELADLTQQLAAFSTSDHLNSHYDDSRRNQSVFQADSSFHGSGVGSSPPPPSPVNSSPLATDLLLPLMSHSALLSHPPPSPHNLCDMEPPSSPSPHHHQHTPQ